MALSEVAHVLPFQPSNRNEKRSKLENSGPWTDRAGFSEELARPPGSAENRGPVCCNVADTANEVQVKPRDPDFSLRATPVGAGSTRIPFNAGGDPTH